MSEATGFVAFCRRWPRAAVSTAALAMWCSGCGDADVTGQWSGSWHLDNSILAGSLDMTLSQTERDVEGSSDIGGSFCVPNGDVSGTVEDHRFRGTIDNGAGRIELDGTVDVREERIDGTFEVVSGLCAGSRGRFDVNR